MIEQQLHPPLFRLPAELREAIYIHALTAAGDEEIRDPVAHTTPHQPSTLRHIPALGTGLLRTCKRVHDELDCRYLFENNVFCFTQPMFLTQFLEHIGEKRRFISTVSFDLREVFHVHNFLFQSHTLLPQWSTYFICMSAGYTKKMPLLPSLLVEDIDWPLQRLTIDLQELQRLLATSGDRSGPAKIAATDVLLRHAIITIPENFRRRVEIRFRLKNRSGEVKEVLVPLLLMNSTQDPKAREVEVINWFDETFNWEKTFDWKFGLLKSD